MRIRTRRRVRAVPPARVRGDVQAAIPPAGALLGARSAHGGRARPRLPRSGDRGAAGGRREGASALPVEVQAAVGCGEPPLLQLVRSAGAEGSERLPHVRPQDGRPPTLPCSPMRAARTASILSVTALL